MEENSAGVWGPSATSALVYGGSVFDRSYSHGVELRDADIQAIISDQISNFGQNTFGETYLTSTGARANIHLWSAGDYLIQQNWVNDRRGRCAMFP